METEVNEWKTYRLPRELEVKYEKKIMPTGKYRSYPEFIRAAIFEKFERDSQ